jgi:hypothetical protein
LTACLSGAFLSAIYLAQWSPLVAAAGVYPWLGFALACKPNVGLVAMSAMRSWRVAFIAAAVAVASVLVALVIDVRWPLKWHALVSASPYYAPMVVRPWGWIPLLALWRWREPGARVLAALTLIPMTPGVRETLFIWLAPFSWWQGVALAASSHFVTPWANRFDPGTQFAQFTDATAQAVLWLVYVPATVFVLLRSNASTRDARAAHRPEMVGYVDRTPHSGA